MPERFSIIHFAAHAETNAQRPLESAVILSRSGDQYKLYARDIATLRLSANLVTISACRSAGARTYGGEGLVGFAWAFLQAGAHAVIAGLWDVGDQTSSALMDRLYEGVSSGMSPAAALRTSETRPSSITKGSTGKFVLLGSLPSVYTVKNLETIPIGRSLLRKRSSESQVRCRRTEVASSCRYFRAEVSVSRKAVRSAPSHPKASMIYGVRLEEAETSESL